MKRWVLALMLAACGQAASPHLQIVVAGGGALTKSACPTLPAGIEIHAQIIVTQADGTSPPGASPCVLSVPEDPVTGAYSVTGECTNIPAQPQDTLILQWYVLGPATGNFVLLAESVGTERIPGDKQTYLATFPAPNVRARATDSDAEKNRFNCDRTGVYTCDTTASPIVVTSDVDTCSNLEELCQGTLFTASATHDTCP